MRSVADRLSGPRLFHSATVFRRGPVGANKSRSRFEQCNLLLRDATASTGRRASGLDMTVQMDFNAQKVVTQWAAEVHRQGTDENGCSSRTVNTINWDIDHGAWLGHFHVKYVNRACFHIPLDGDAQIDKATYEIDYWNKIAIGISPDKKHIVPQPSNWNSDNVSPIVKMLLQAVGALVQIVTVGMVPQADVQFSDGHQAEADALRFMLQYELSKLQSVSAPDPQDQGGFPIEFLYQSAAFRKDGTRPILSITASQNTSNLPNEGEACTIREALVELQTGGKHIGPNGTNYTVVPGDSLWNIATRLYGNGRYYLLIAAANGIPSEQMDRLPVKTSLRIDSIATFRTRKDILLVMKDDSIWKIASKHAAVTGSFKSLENANTGLTDPNLIYPVQVLHIPPAPR